MGVKCHSEKKEQDKGGMDKCVHGRGQDLSVTVKFRVGPVEKVIFELNLNISVNPADTCGTAFAKALRGKCTVRRKGNRL